MSTLSQKTIELTAPNRGYHLITEKITQAMPEMHNLEYGMLHLFIQHTSASLTINENWDATVRSDMRKHIDVLVPENAPYYEHNYEGADDMPAHIKTSLLGCSLSIPVSNGTLNLGTWQGIYLCEHRDAPTSRSIVLTLQD